MFIKKFNKVKYKYLWVDCLQQNLIKYENGKDKNFTHFLSGMKTAHKERKTILKRYE